MTRSKFLNQEHEYLAPLYKM